MWSERIPALRSDPKFYEKPEYTSVVRGGDLHLEIVRISNQVMAIADRSAE